MKRKICVVVTARPSYSRIQTALKAIESHPDLELQLVVAASALLDRYGNTIKHILEDGFKIAAHVYMIVEGENLVTSAKSTGLGLVEIATAFDNLKPDMVITIADRYETIATAIAASYMNIPLVHIQGGEVTGSIDEKVRHAVTKLSNFHFVATEKAAERVKKLGEDERDVFVTGCPSIDLAKCVLGERQLGFDPFDKYGGVGRWMDVREDFIVVMQHPVTTEYTLARAQANETLCAIRDLKIPTLWFWPNVDAGSDGTSKEIRIFRESGDASNMHFFKNMNGKDFLRLLMASKCIVGNSSVAIRECCFLGVPAVNIGTRQANRERGRNVIDVDYDRDQIMQAVRKQIANGQYEIDYTYGQGDAGQRIADLAVKIPLKIEKQLTY
jgi:UDP-hydrolysing UDP-N-acetyl-D-glucosamine 2-epimerase